MERKVTNGEALETLGTRHPAHKCPACGKRFAVWPYGENGSVILYCPDILGCEELRDFGPDGKPLVWQKHN
jgi:hypothetical protein